MSKIYSMGIDPGERNLGWAILDNEGNRIDSGVIDVKEAGMTSAVIRLKSLAERYSVSKLGLERFVAYAGKLTKNNEPVLMTTGAIQYAFESMLIVTHLARAIDWKPKVCKNLFKRSDFKNPSKNQKFDKEYSMAAAKCIAGEEPATDHEADAICLAYYAGEIML